jgi:hypothetical protein
MALLVIILGSKNKEKNYEILHPKGTPVQILTKKGLNLSFVKQISPWNPSDGTFELFWGPGKFSKNTRNFKI